MNCRSRWIFLKTIKKSSFAYDKSRGENIFLVKFGKELLSYMPTQITNQANIAFNYGNVAGSATSNVATTTLLDPIAAEKRSVGATYRAGERITYTVSIVNNGNATLQNVTVTDDLGAYTAGGVTYTPLDFAEGASLYVNGAFVSAIEGTVGANGVVFVIPTLAPGANALIVYNADVNAFAPLAEGSTIVNTAAVTAQGATTSVIATNTVTVEDYANITILKEMSPDPVSDGDVLTYTFTIRNFGNTPATDVVLTDNFAPAPAAITVTVGGEIVPETNYTYENGLLTLPTGEEFSMTIPAATVTQDTTTGEVTVTPGTLIITVSGVI